MPSASPDFPDGSQESPSAAMALQVARSPAFFLRKETVPARKPLPPPAPRRAPGKGEGRKNKLGKFWGSQSRRCGQARRWGASAGLPGCTRDGPVAHQGGHGARAGEVQAGLSSWEEGVPSPAASAWRWRGCRGGRGGRGVGCRQGAGAGGERAAERRAAAAPEQSSGHGVDADRSRPLPLQPPTHSLHPRRPSPALPFRWAASRAASAAASCQPLLPSPPRHPVPGRPRGSRSSRS